MHKQFQSSKRRVHPTHHRFDPTRRWALVCSCKSGKSVALPDIFGVRNGAVLGKIYIEENIMVKLQELHPQYITNEDGKRTSVILPIVEFKKLLEDIEDLASVAERREEPTISHEDPVAELKKDGLL